MGARWAWAPPKYYLGGPKHSSDPSKNNVLTIMPGNRRRHYDVYVLIFDTSAVQNNRLVSDSRRPKHQCHRQQQN